MYFCMMNGNHIKPKTKQKYLKIEVCNQESLEKFKAEIANAEIYARLQKNWPMIQTLTTKCYPKY